MQLLKKLITKDFLPYTYIVFYMVGVTLYAIPETRSIFIAITPYSLILVAWAALYHHNKWNAKSIVILSLIFLISIIIEAVGVRTGKIFGTYSYGVGLGLKVFDVPILIGLNWIILVYGSNSLLSKITSSSILRIMGASVLMVVFDLMLEQAAPLMKMWKFDAGNPPFQNYFAWLLLAAIFNMMLEVFKINTQNKPARALFIIQFAFFVALYAVNKI